MKAFRDIPVSRKLRLIILLTSGLALLAACAAFLIYDQRSYRDVMIQDLLSQAEIVGNSSAGALAYGDADAASQYLEGLRANPSIVSGWLWDTNRAALGVYPRGRHADQLAFDPLNRPDGTYVERDRIHVVRQIREKGVAVGTVYLEASRAELRDRLVRYGGVVGLVFVGAVVLAFLLSMRLQRLITEPVLHLTETATQVATGRSYSVRATKQGEDELGRLIDCFNEMLDQIQARDRELSQARDLLEARVAERTGELSEANARLKQEMAERSRLEGQLRQAQKMEAIGQLAGGVAHDFNNVLTVILGHSSLLLSLDGLTPDMTEALKEVDSSARRAANLTRQLLTFSRRQSPRLAPTNLNQTLSNVARMLQRLLGEQITLEFRFASEVPAVQADVNMMEQVVMNLAVNARDAMPRGGSLTLATEVVRIGPEEVARHPEARPGRFVRFTVTDTGCGMDSTVLQRIFEPFFTTKPQGKGTGLGLATVYGIVRQHEGWIEVLSEVGVGTSFRVFLPCAATPATAKGDTRFWGAARRGTETVLLVEDEDPVRNFVALCLRRYGYHVIEARNGKQALDMWDEWASRVDLLLTDLVMPEGVSGRELAERLEKDKPGLAVIYSSGYSQDIFKGDLPLKEGFNYLPKPYDPIHLVRIVRERLDQAIAPVAG